MAARASRYASRSCLVMRAPAPVPRTWLKSMLFSRAILRTSGDSGPAASSGVGAGSAATGAGAAGGGGGGAAEAGAGAGGAGAAAAGAAAGAPAPSLILPTTVLMPTVVPSCTRISPSVPATGDGISVSTLSVEISNSGSSRSTLSPGFFNHFVKVPSTMLSPIWGMMTSIINSPFHGRTLARNRGRGRRQPGRDQPGTRVPASRSPVLLNRTVRCTGNNSSPLSRSARSRGR